MLTFEAPFYEIEDVVVFRDHAIPTQFYYLAGPPRLTRGSDDKPHLLMLKYRNALDAVGDAGKLMRDQLGGAFLMFGVDCGVDEPKKDRIRSALQSKLPPDAGAVALGPVLYTRGTVSIIALDSQKSAATATEGGAATTEAQSRFVRGIVGSSVPSLLQDQRAIFSLSLPPDAATLLEDAYQSDLSPIGVMYELEFSGLRPAVSVKATVDYKRCYELFKVGLKVHVGTGGGADTSANAGGGGAQGGGAQAGVAASGGRGTPTGTPGTRIPDGTQLVNNATQRRYRVVGEVVLNGTAASGAVAAVPNTNAVNIVAVDVGAAGNLALPATLNWVNPASGAIAGLDATLKLDVALTGGTDAVAAPAAGAAGAGAAAGAAAANANKDTANKDGANKDGANKNTQTETKKAGGGSTEVSVDADLSLSLEKLKEEGAITIEIIRMQEGQTAEAMEKAAMDLIKENIIKDLFKPAMTDQPASPIQQVAGAVGAVSNAINAGTANTSSGSAGGGTKVQIGFSLQYKKQEELKTVTFDFTASAPETRKHCPNGFFSALVTRSEKTSQIREINLDDPFFQVIDVQASTIADFDALSLGSVALNFRYHDAAGTKEFTRAHPEPGSFHAFKSGNDLAYQYNTDYEFAQTERIAAQRYRYETPWASTVTRALVVNPAVDLAMLQVYLEPGVVDWEIISRIETRLRYEDRPNGFSTERTFFIAADSQRQQWCVRLTDASLDRYFVRHVWHLKDGSSITGDEEVSTVSHLFVGDPFVDRLPVILQPQVDPTKVLRVVVEIEYIDRDNNLFVHKNVELVGPTYRSTRVEIPIMDRERREYAYKVSLIRANGGAENQDLVRTEDLSVAIAEAAGGVYYDVNLVLLGDLAARSIDALMVDLRATPPEGEVPTIESHLFERTGEKKVTKRLFVRADRPREFEYRTTIIFATGDQVEGEWKLHQKNILPISVAGLSP